jgi:hypothetical protein
MELYLHSPNTPSWRGAQLQHRDNFTFNFISETEDSRQRLGIFLFDTASRPALGLTQPPIQWVAGVLSLGVKRPGPDADHSPPSSAEFKECVDLYLHSTIRLHSVVLS